jgi:hypothetical protein
MLYWAGVFYWATIVLGSVFFASAIATFILTRFNRFRDRAFPVATIIIFSLWFLMIGSALLSGLLSASANHNG